MPNDTGLIGLKDGGRWVDHEKDGRKRMICFYANDDKNDANDQSYVGYYHNAKDTDYGCNLSLSIGHDSIDIQYVKPGDKDGKTIIVKSFTHEEFMNMLDMLLKIKG